jgi:hypothetical protein
MATFDRPFEKKVSLKVNSSVLFFYQSSSKDDTVPLDDNESRVTKRIKFCLPFSLLVHTICI